MIGDAYDANRDGSSVDVGFDAANRKVVGTKSLFPSPTRQELTPRRLDDQTG